MYLLSYYGEMILLKKRYVRGVMVWFLIFWVLFERVVVEIEGRRLVMVGRRVREGSMMVVIWGVNNEEKYVYGSD